MAGVVRFQLKFWGFKISLSRLVVGIRLVIHRVSISLQRQAASSIFLVLRCGALLDYARGVKAH